MWIAPSFMMRRSRAWSCRSRTSRSVARGALYVTLDRLEEKGYLKSWLAEATAERGGRAKRFYEVKPAGTKALEHSWTALRAMWAGLEPKRREA